MMGRKVKKKKSGIHISVAFPLLVVMAALVYISMMTQGNPLIFQENYDDKTWSYSSSKLSPDSSEDITRPVAPSKIETDPSSFITPDKFF